MHEIACMELEAMCHGPIVSAARQCAMVRTCPMREQPLGESWQCTPLRRTARVNHSNVGSKSDKPSPDGAPNHVALERTLTRGSRRHAVARTDIMRSEAA